jgi:hypothetical protein
MQRSSRSRNRPPTSKAKRPLKAFLCHSKRDKKAIRRLYTKLLKDNVRVWFDEKDLLPGQDWTLLIQWAVQDSDVVLICLSRGAIDNKGYIHREIQLALDIAQLQPEGSIFIVPVRLEECEIPQRLQKYQWSSLFQRGGYSRLLSSLKERASELGRDL